MLWDPKHEDYYRKGKKYDARFCISGDLSMFLMSREHTAEGYVRGQLFLEIHCTSTRDVANDDTTERFRTCSACLV